METYSKHPSLTNLSHELICNILQFLPIREILSVGMLCRKLSIAVNMHFRLCKSIDFCPHSVDDYMPSSIRDDHLQVLFKKCPELEVVYGLHPWKIERRRLRKRSALTVPGVIDALSLCYNLKAIETCDLRLLEAVLQHLPHIEIIGHFQNRDYMFPPHASQKLKLQPYTQITSLHLIGVEVPELTAMPHLRHLHLQCVKFTKLQPFRAFLAQNLKSFVMKNCIGPAMSLSYLSLIIALSSAVNLNHLELVRVPLPGGLFQRAVEDAHGSKGFTNLRTLVVSGCKGVLEVDLGHLMIIASKKLETLYIQPSLTKDSLFVSLSYAQCTFPSFRNLHLGYIDSLNYTGEWSNEALVSLGLAEVPDTPSSITDSGMKVIGQLLPHIKSLSVSNCPHLMTMYHWMPGPNGHGWSALTDLTLQKCHCLQLSSFSVFVSLLQNIQVIILYEMFKEPPKGCSHVGLSAGTGLGMSSAVVSNQDEHLAVQGHPVQDFDHPMEDEVEEVEREVVDPENEDNQEPHFMVLRGDFFEEDEDIDYMEYENRCINEAVRCCRAGYFSDDSSDSNYDEGHDHARGGRSGAAKQSGVPQNGAPSNQNESSKSFKSDVNTKDKSLEKPVTDSKNTENPGPSLPSKSPDSKYLYDPHQPSTSKAGMHLDYSFPQNSDAAESEKHGSSKRTRKQPASHNVKCSNSQEMSKKNVHCIQNKANKSSNSGLDNAEAVSSMSCAVEKNADSTEQGIKFNNHNRSMKPRIVVVSKIAESSQADVLQSPLRNEDGETSLGERESSCPKSENSSCLDVRKAKSNKDPKQENSHLSSSLVDCDLLSQTNSKSCDEGNVSEDSVNLPGTSSGNSRFCPVDAENVEGRSEKSGKLLNFDKEENKLSDSTKFSGSPQSNIELKEFDSFANDDLNLFSDDYKPAHSNDFAVNERNLENKNDDKINCNNSSCGVSSSKVAEKSDLSSGAKQKELCFKKSTSDPVTKNNMFNAKASSLEDQENVKSSLFSEQTKENTEPDSYKITPCCVVLNRIKEFSLEASGPACKLEPTMEKMHVTPKSEQSNSSEDELKNVGMPEVSLNTREFDSNLKQTSRKYLCDDSRPSTSRSRCYCVMRLPTKRSCEPTRKYASKCRKLSRSCPSEMKKIKEIDCSNIKIPVGVKKDSEDVGRDSGSEIKQSGRNAVEDLSESRTESFHSNTSDSISSTNYKMNECKVALPEIGQQNSQRLNNVKSEARKSVSENPSAKANLSCPCGPNIPSSSKHECVHSRTGSRKGSRSRSSNLGSSSKNSHSCKIISTEERKPNFSSDFHGSNVRGTKRRARNSQSSHNSRIHKANVKRPKPRGKTKKCKVKIYPDDAAALRRNRHSYIDDRFHLVPYSPSEVIIRMYNKAGSRTSNRSFHQTKRGTSTTDSRCTSFPDDATNRKMPKPSKKTGKSARKKGSGKRFSNRKYPSKSRESSKSSEKLPASVVVSLVSQGTQANSADIRRSVRRIRRVARKAFSSRPSFFNSSKISARRVVKKTVNSRRPETLDKATSTSDPLLEDDAVQVLKMASSTLLSFTIIACGISDLIIENCPKLFHLEVQACRILKKLQFNSCSDLQRFNISQCPKLTIHQLAQPVLSIHNPESYLLVSYEPCMQNYYPGEGEGVILSHLPKDETAVICHDFQEFSNEAIQARMKDKIMGWLQYLSTAYATLNFTLDNQRKVPFCSYKKSNHYPYDHDVRRIHGEYMYSLKSEFCHAVGHYQVLSNNPLFSEAFESHCLDKEFPAFTDCEATKNNDLFSKEAKEQHLMMNGVVGFYIPITEYNRIETYKLASTD